MKKVLILVILMSQMTVFGQTRKTIVTDSSGNVVSTPIAFSNQFSIYTNATTSVQPVRYGEYTNSAVSIITSGKLPLSFGGTSTNTTMLVGSWTNTINFTVSGTNNANAFSVKGVLGVTGSITNLGPGTGSSNVIVFCDGIITNRFTIP